MNLPRVIIVPAGYPRHWHSALTTHLSAIDGTEYDLAAN